MIARALFGLMLSLAGLFRIPPLVTPSRDRTRRIAFFAYSVHLAQFYRPIIEQLRSSPDAVRVTLVIMLHPHFQLQTLRELREFGRQELGLPASNIVYRWQVMWERFDLAVFADVYAEFPLRKTRTCLLTHGPGLQQRFFSRNWLRKSIHDFDLVLVSGDYDRELVRRFATGQAEGPSVYAVGVPFLDALRDANLSPSMYPRQLGLDPNRRTVLVAPHWTTLAAVAPNDGYLEELVTRLQPFDVNILIKLHACSLNSAMGGPVDWRVRLAELARHSRVRIDEQVDDLPALRHADVLITDISSRGFNFMLLNKPVILYSRESSRSDELGRLRSERMCRGAFVADSVSEVIAVLEGLNAERRTLPGAAEVARECFSNFGSATQAAVDVLMRDLNGGTRGATSGVSHSSTSNLSGEPSK